MHVSKSPRQIKPLESLHINQKGEQNHHNYLKSRFISTNISNPDIAKNNNLNQMRISELQHVKHGIFKSSNMINSNNPMPTQTNSYQKNTINFKINPENSKKFIFNSIPINNNTLNSSLSTNNTYMTNSDSTYNNLIKLTTQKNIDQNNLNNLNNFSLNNNLLGNIISQNESNLGNLNTLGDLNFNLNQDIKALTDNQNLNRILEHSINNIIINFLTKSQMQSQQNNMINDHSFNNGPLLNQIDVVALLHNKNDFLNLPPNFGNVLMNSLIEAYKQNNIQNNKNNYNQNFAPNNSSMNYNINSNTLNNQNNIINKKKIILEKNEDEKIKLKKQIKTDPRSPSSFNKKKPKFVSVNDINNNFSPNKNVQYRSCMTNNNKKNEYFLNNKSENSRQEYISQDRYVLKDYQIGNASNKQLNLNLTEKTNNNSYNNSNNNQEYYSEKEKSNRIIQKSGRVVKKNRLYDSEEFETHNVAYKKSIGRKRKNNSNNNITHYPKREANEEVINDNKNNNSIFHHNFSELGKNVNHKKNNDIPKDNSQEMNKLINLAYINNYNNSRNMKAINQLISNNGENNTNISNLEEELKFPRQRFENETNISQRNIEIESSYNFNPRSNFYDEYLAMNYSNLNLGNLGAKYIFTPHDQSEMTVELYNQESLNNKHNNKYSYNNHPTNQLINNNDNLNNGAFSNFYNHQSENNNLVNNAANLNINNIPSTTLLENSLLNNHSNITYGEQLHNHHKSGCCKKRNSFSQSSVATTNELLNAQNNTNFSNWSQGHHQSCCKRKVKVDKNEQINDNNINKTQIILNNFNKNQNENNFPNANSFKAEKDLSPTNIDQRKYYDGLNENISLRSFPLEQIKYKNYNNFDNSSLNSYPGSLNQINLIKNNSTYNTLSNSQDQLNIIDNNLREKNVNFNNNTSNNISYDSNKIATNTPERVCCQSVNKTKETNIENVYNNNNNLNVLSKNNGCCQSSSFKLGSNSNANNILNEQNKSSENEYNEKHNLNKTGLKKSPSIHLLNSLNSTLNYQEEQKDNCSNNGGATNSNINSIDKDLKNNNSENTISNGNNSSNNSIKIKKEEDVSVSVPVPVFKKNNNVVKIFKPIAKNKDVLNSFDRINNFLAPINIQNYNGGVNKNINIMNNDFNNFNDMTNFSINRNINMENNFTENKKYPQLCSKNLYLESHNVENNPRNAAGKKIIHSNEDKFLDKKCLEICGDLLICPELLPINCQKYLNRECDCVEKCKEKDSIYRDFIASNKALTDLEF